jgi:hypothetical protein
MNRKYVATALIGCAVILGWNAFLIQRDAKLFEAYNQPIQQQK